MQTASQPAVNQNQNRNQQTPQTEIWKTKKSAHVLRFSYNSHLILIRLGQSQTADAGQRTVSGFEAGASTMSHANRWQCEKKTTRSVWRDG